MSFPRRFLSFPNLILILILISNASFSADKSEVTNSVDSPKTNVPVSSAPTDYKLRPYRDWETDRKSTRLNSSHLKLSRMPSSA